MHFMQTMDTPTMNTFSISELKDIFMFLWGMKSEVGGTMKKRKVSSKG